MPLEASQSSLAAYSAVDNFPNSTKALSQNHQHSSFCVVTSLHHMRPMQTILLCPILKQMHMLSTFCLSNVSKSCPLIVEKSVTQNHLKGLKRQDCRRLSVGFGWGRVQSNWWFIFLYFYSTAEWKVQRNQKVVHLFSSLFFHSHSVKRRQRKEEEGVLWHRTEALRVELPCRLLFQQRGHKWMLGGSGKSCRCSAYSAITLAHAEPRVTLRTSWGCPNCHTQTREATRLHALAWGARPHSLHTATTALEAQPGAQPSSGVSTNKWLACQGVAQSRPENDVPSINTHMSHLL